MPVLSIGHFLTVDDAGQREYVIAGLGVGDCGFQANTLRVLFPTSKSKSAFGNVFTRDYDFQSRVPNARGLLHRHTPVFAAFFDR